MDVERMPLIAGVPLAAATMQVIADDAGVDLLHVKGAAVDASLLEHRTVVDPDTGETVTEVVPRASLDADILVRPSHIRRLFAAMRDHRWTMVYRFADGSPFEHASTWVRPGVCHVDVHRSFPGIGQDAEAAFDHLWAERHTAPLAGHPCPVPSLAAQRLILILHAVRGGDLAHPDIQRCWGAADAEQRADVDALAARLHAEVALAAGTGRLEAHRGAREYALWRALSTGDTSLSTLWVARVRAQPTPWRALRTAFHLVAPKTDRLERELGRRPGPVAFARAWASQLALVAGEARRLVRGRLRGTGRP